MTNHRRPRILRRTTLDDMLVDPSPSNHRPARPASKAQLRALWDMRMRELDRVTARLIGIQRRLNSLEEKTQ